MVELSWHTLAAFSECHESSEDKMDDQVEQELKDMSSQRDSTTI
jgi:hypothetical protein